MFIFVYMCEFICVCVCVIVCVCVLIYLCVFIYVCVQCASYKSPPAPGMCSFFDLKVSALTLNDASKVTALRPPFRDPRGQ